MEPFLYQTVHLFGGRARMLKEHVARLHVASCEIFGRPYRPDLKLIEERLLAEVARAPMRSLRLYASNSLTQERSISMVSVHRSMPATLCAACAPRCTRYATTCL